MEKEMRRRIIVVGDMEAGRSNEKGKREGEATLYKK